MEATIAHELNNALTICEGYIKMNNPKYHNLLLNELKRSKELLNNVLNDNYWFNMNELFHEIIIFNNVYQQNKKVDFIYHENNYKIYGNYNSLKQLFINLVKNSIEAITYNGYIDLNVKKENNSYVIELCDNGEGIDSDTLKYINSGCIISSNGHGIGLKVINEIIKNHNGKIEYISKLHYGTLVRIIIPIN